MVDKGLTRSFSAHQSQRLTGELIVYDILQLHSDLI